LGPGGSTGDDGECAAPYDGMGRRHAVTRRVFLLSGAAATGGLALGTAFLRLGRAGPGAPFVPGPFLSIGADGVVTVTVARAEIGQGSRTALAMIVAEELDADWSKVRIEQGDLDPKYGEQYVGGSAVVRTSWKPLRQAGAAAREMLVAAAARQWGVQPRDCRTESGRVIHPPSGRASEYGQLVALARAETVPKNAALKDPTTFRIIGKSRANLDHAAIVEGRMRFGIDTRVPGMLFAVIERAPVLGGKPARLGTERARKVLGVRDVVIVDGDSMPEFGENNPKPANGVAVVADSTWAALQGRRALEVDWDHRGGGVESTARMRKACIAASRLPSRWVTERGGDIDHALSTCHQRIEAVYETPLLAHAPMEPMNCVADVRPGRCEVWAPCQNPEYVRDAAERITGLPPGATRVHVTRSGGAFGRRFYADFAAEAIAVSKAVGAPVQVVWTREDDLRYDFYRPAGYHVLRGGLDAAGRIAAWEHRLWNASRGHFLKWRGPAGGELNPGELSRDDYPVSYAPAFRFGYTPIESRIPRGQWRAVENSSNVFVTQSFLDELAHLARADPLEFQIELLARPPPPDSIRRAGLQAIA
jgi:isoquinoline 1-oxidoreductase beta subunit